MTGAGAGAGARAAGLAARLARGGTGAVVAVVTGGPDDGAVEIAGAGRIAGPGSPEPGPGTLFEIGSVTKVFTGPALAAAVVRGEASLEEPVRDLLPAGTPLPSFRGREIALGRLDRARSPGRAMPAFLADLAAARA
ncbi:serine hydrolase [Bailinhaonella thermotolerans]|uniref:Beta-lactamase-related domain-containing protein n=1 Tax=Bailinhaonella thermotolerans TaxID=1070861 RepID=A0A3A4B2G4_9ACTN|nr:serine hydrolase [Bailinhaonella thermotolerans]RJL35341.1 hypothetical protein D5H75_00485 [Bailinhaonella thermotolerans]